MDGHCITFQPFYVYNFHYKMLTENIDFFDAYKTKINYLFNFLI